MLMLIVVILLVLMIAGSFPTYPYSRGWGYGPSGILGLILVIILIVWLVSHLSSPATLP